MATVFSNTNLTGMNRKQLKAIARNIGVAHDNSTTTAALLTAIKAK
jgi:hypothetical protein